MLLIYKKALLDNNQNIKSHCNILRKYIMLKPYKN